MTTPDPAAASAPAASAAPASTPAAAPVPAPAAPERDPNQWVPYARFQEVNSAANEAKAKTAAAEARAAELERKVGRLELRADLGIDDDDDADRVLSAYEKAHADVKADKRPKARDWVKAEGVLDTLPKSIRTAYGAAWAQAAGQTPVQGAGQQGQPAAAARGAAAPPPTARGTGPAPTSRAGDPAAGMSQADAIAAYRRLNGR